MIQTTDLIPAQRFFLFTAVTERVRHRTKLSLDCYLEMLYTSGWIAEVGVSSLSENLNWSFDLVSRYYDSLVSSTNKYLQEDSATAVLGVYYKPCRVWVQLQATAERWTPTSPYLFTQTKVYHWKCPLKLWTSVAIILEDPLPFSSPLIMRGSEVYTRTSSPQSSSTYILHCPYSSVLKRYLIRLITFPEKGELTLISSLVNSLHDGQEATHSELTLCQSKALNALRFIWGSNL